MDKINEMRLLAGIPIDSSRERSAKPQTLVEARTVPLRKHELTPKNEKSMAGRIKGVDAAIGHIKRAIKSLEKVPATDFMGDIPHYIDTLEDMLTSDDGEGGLIRCYDNMNSDQRKFKRSENVKKKAEEEMEMMVNEEIDIVVAEKNREGAETAVRQAIAHCKKMSTEESDHDLKSMHAKDGQDFTRILNHMRNIDDDSARFKLNREMDTAAREHLSDPTVVIKKSDRQAASKFFGYELLREAKKAKNDYDGDGKIESPEDEHKGVVAKAIKKSKDKKSKDKKIDEAKKENFPKNDSPEGKIMTDQKAHDEAAEKIDKVVDENPRKDKKVKKTDESMMYYTDNFNDFEDDDAKPINVAKGDENEETVFDKPNDPANSKDESPNQLDNPGRQSATDQTTKIRVPDKVKSELKTEIAQARKDADFQGKSTANKEAKMFYNDLANAFEKLLTHLEGGTVMDIKKAQIFFSSLMGPMLHKVPGRVSDFIVNGGQARSLKDYIRKGPEPITGPRNTLS